MERKIGEIFEDRGCWYQCIRDITCNNCGFNNKGCLADRHITGDCSGRLDGASVVFKKLVKVGEPYIFSNMAIHNITMQQYKVFVKPIFTDNSIITTYNMINETISIEIKNKEDMEEYRMHDAKEDIPEFDKVVDECLFGEAKLNLKPFDLEAAKAGKPVCTKDGRKARVICFDAKSDAPIIALITDYDGKEISFDYTIDGIYFSGDNSENDLMMLSEEKEGWAIMLKDKNHQFLSHAYYRTREEAETMAKFGSDKVVDIFKFNYHE